MTTKKSSGSLVSAVPDDAPFVTTASRVGYQNPWIRVREDTISRSDGRDGVYGVLEVNDSVAIVAVNDQQEICLIESYRHPVQAWTWEIPGGGSDGEAVLVAAQRELREETGLSADQWQVLGKTRVCDGLSTEHQITVLARGVVPVEQFVQEDEVRALGFFSLEQIDAMIAEGVFASGQSITSLYLYRQWLQRTAPST